MPMTRPVPAVLPTALRLVVCVFATFAFVACTDGGPPRGPSLDSNTNWLTACTEDADCILGTSCLCGQCTLGCADDSACTSLGGGVCATPGDASWDAMCTEPAPPVCLPICTTDADCDTEHYCVSGGCIPQWAESSATNPPDAGGTDGGGTDAGVQDGGSDAGPTDAGPTDAGPTDAASDADPGDGGATDGGTDTDPDAEPDADEPDADEPDATPIPCVEDGTLHCGRLIGNQQSGVAATYTCEAGEWVRVESCAFDCVYVDGADDLCVQDCPTDRPGTSFCGGDIGLPEMNVYACAAGRIALEGICTLSCRIDPRGRAGCQNPDAGGGGGG